MREGIPTVTVPTVPGCEVVPHASGISGDVTTDGIVRCYMCNRAGQREVSADTFALLCTGKVAV